MVGISACYGAHLLGDMASMKPAPCLMMIGPMQEVHASDLMAGFRLFYRTVFETGRAGLATTKLAHQAPDVWHITHAEYWFELVTTNYVKDECTRKAIRRRALDLFRRSQRDGFPVSMGTFKREILRAHSKDLSGAMFDTFFMLDAFPTNRQRFDHARRRLEAKLDGLRRTGLYML